MLLGSYRVFKTKFQDTSRTKSRFSKSLKLQFYRVNTIAATGAYGQWALSMNMESNAIFMF